MADTKAGHELSRAENSIQPQFVLIFIRYFNLYNGVSPVPQELYIQINKIIKLIWITLAFLFIY